MPYGVVDHCGYPLEPGGDSPEIVLSAFLIALSPFAPLLFLAPWPTLGYLEFCSWSHAGPYGRGQKDRSPSFVVHVLLPTSSSPFSPVLFYLYCLVSSSALLDPPFFCFSDSFYVCLA